jgi:DNA-binding transcriptional ArsR family regulator
MDRFVALADPKRRRMLELLSAGQLSAGEIAATFEISAPAVSQHLKALREAGLVRVSVEGQRRIYCLDLQGLASIDQWLAQVRGLWRGRLDTLEAKLRGEQGGTA